MNKILIISNSQGSSAGINIGESYPTCLQKMFSQCIFHYLILSGGTIQDVYEKMEHCLLIRPDLVLVQIGIVECTQRILSRRTKTILSILPFGKKVTKTLHNHRKTVVQIKNKLGLIAREMPPDIFKHWVEKCTKTFHDASLKYLFLKIPPIPLQYETEFFPYINADITTYNDILETFGAVPMLQLQENTCSIWQPGTVHLNVKGHNLVAHRLKNLIEHTLALQNSPSHTGL